MASARILLFTKTTGYRHDSLPDGVRLIEERASEAGIAVDHTEDESLFSEENLARYAGVVWLQVSGDVLDESGREAFAAYLRSGGGFAGIHGASDAERTWPEYENIVGARFRFHPQDQPTQTASVITELDDPSTASIPRDWQWCEEWYAFTRNPRGDVEILLRVDESAYDPETAPMGEDHPVCWRGRVGAGKTWYTALGHSSESYSDSVFRDHIWGGVLSVLR
jgi:type 1 glutamine amidotransferase